MDYLIKEETLQGIANSIKESTGNDDPIDVSDFEDEIRTIYQRSADIIPVAEETFDAYTTSTASSQVASIELDLGFLNFYTSTNYMLYVSIEDVDGKRAGYFYACYSVLPLLAFNTSGAAQTSWSRVSKYDSSSFQGSGTSFYGVYPYSFYTDSATKTGTLVINMRYNSTYSKTINGTYKAKVFLIKSPI